MAPYRHLCIGLICALFTSFAWSQDLNKGFVRVDNEQLGGKSIASIIKDRSGFMWFGTSEGLCRFDGTNLKVYKHTSGDSTTLCHNEVIDIAEDHHGNLWIGTANGLCQYNREKDNFLNIAHFSAGSDTLTNHYITSLAVDKAGKIWIGSLGGGVNILDPATTRVMSHLVNGSPDIYQPSSYINAICIHRDRAWVGTRAGLKIFDLTTLRSSLVTGLDEGLFSTAVTSITPGEQGNLLIGLSSGDVKELVFNNKQVDVNNYTNITNITGAASYIHKMSYDATGNLWLVTEKSGLLQIAARGRHITTFVPQEGNAHSAPAFSLRTVYCDELKRVWVGTYNSGVYCIDGGLKKFELYQRNPLHQESLRDNYVRAFAEDKGGNIWIASNAGVNKFNMTTREISNPHTINDIAGHRVIKDIIVDSQENLWIGTRDDGVFKINLKTNDHHHYDVLGTGIGNNKIVCLYQDKRHIIWAGTLGSGLFYLDKIKNQFVLLDERDKKDHVPDKSYVTSIIESADNTLWVGTLNGLFALHRQGGNEFTYQGHYHHAQPKTLSSSRIIVVHEDAAHTLWIGTLDNGMNRFINEKGVFEAHTEENGLSSNNIKGIMHDRNGNLWISSTAGISVFDSSDKKSKHYSSADGLNSNTFNANACMQTKSGHMIVGGDNGFNIFHPDSIASNMIPPRMYLTDLRINNVPVRIDAPDSPLSKQICLTESISLTHDQRSFAIDFVALNYTPSSRNRYCYRLDGFEKEWTCIGADHTATYTNIDPGNYTFVVKGTNGDGIWSTKPAQLAITIHPPFWKTWWAKLLYVLISGGSIYILLKLRTSQIHIRNELKLERIAREKEHELTLSKMHFFTNMSHELRTPLSLILMPLEKVAAASDVPMNIRRTLATAYRNASNLMKLVNELMDFSKFDEIKPKPGVQQGEIVGFISEIANMFSDVSEQKNIRLTLLPSPAEIHGWFDHDKVEKIVRNILSNAFKFTQTQGEIKVIIQSIDRLTKSSNYRHAEITIIDNGIGIAPEELPMIFDKFYQARSTSSVLHSGTGIGLSLTQTLVEAHKGTIRVESVRDIGTKFVITLPIDASAFSENEILQTSPEVMDVNDIGHEHDYNDVVIDQSIGKPELLIIEDNDELRQFLVEEFSAEFSIFSAREGDDGLRLACEKVPDLIISDIVLPGKTGLEVCKEIKADLRTSHIPVILLTAKASPDDQVVGLESGADIYLIKPFNLRVLRVHVRQIVASRRKLYSRFSQDVYLTPGSLTDNAIDKEFLQKAVEYIDHNLLNTQLSVETIADLFSISRSQVYRKIKALTGQTVVEFIRTIRLKQALKLMEERRYTLSEIAFQTGFNSLSYFTRSFKDQYGKTPSEYVGTAK